MTGRFYWTAEQLAERFGVTPLTVRRWHYRGHLKSAIKIGGILRFPCAAVKEFEKQFEVQREVTS